MLSHVVYCVDYGQGLSAWRTRIAFQAHIRHLSAKCLSRCRSDSESKNSPMNCKPGLPARRCIPHFDLMRQSMLGWELRLVTERRSLDPSTAISTRRHVMPTIHSAIPWRADKIPFQPVLPHRDASSRTRDSRDLHNKRRDRCIHVQDGKACRSTTCLGPDPVTTMTTLRASKSDELQPTLIVRSFVCSRISGASPRAGSVADKSKLLRLGLMRKFRERYGL
jgi:hypothetical protein